MSSLALTAQMPTTTANPLLTEMADPARVLARNIGKNVGRILAALQIGDITRQRAEHVKAGLALFDGFDRSATQPRLRAAGEMLLAAQLEAALKDYNQQVSKLLPSIDGLASNALALAALSDLVAELGDSGPDLRDLKRRMDAAVQLFAEIQAADGASRYLAGRLANDKGAIAANDAVQPASGDHPLHRRASDLLARINYLEAAAADCVVILERLKEASEALTADSPAPQPDEDLPELQSDSYGILAAAAERIKAILEKAEGDIAAHAGKPTDIRRLLDHAASSPISDEPYANDLEVGGCADLNFNALDVGPDDEAFRRELSALLAQIEGLYAMGQEREVHRAFSRACGLETADEPVDAEDGLF